MVRVESQEEFFSLDKDHSAQEFVLEPGNELFDLHSGPCISLYCWVTSDDSPSSENGGNRDNGHWGRLLPEGQPFVSDVTREDRNCNPHQMGNGIDVLLYPHGGQDLIGQQEADGPGLKKGNPVHESKVERRADRRMPGVLEYEKLRQDKCRDHAGEVGDDDCTRKSHEPAVEETAPEIDPGRQSTRSQKEKEFL